MKTTPRVDNQVKAEVGKFVLRGASKATLKAIPKFDYAK